MFEKTNLQNRQVFQKTISLLTRPISLGAIVLLLINDHLLRKFWPSWWTGKIGDFAWLFFFPFLLAIFLAWLIPSRLSNQEKIVRWLAFGLTGSVYILANTLPEFHAFTVGALEWALNCPVALKRDPTDLIALVSLGAAWWFWDHQSNSIPSPIAPIWIALPLSILLTVGNLGVEENGITELGTENGNIIARSTLWDFTSKDGGISWQQNETRITDNSIFLEENEEYKKYRFTPGVLIEISENNGVTWPYKLTLSQPNQAELVHYENREGNSHYRAGPLDAVIDNATKNIIFAMGHEGVLVFTGSSREWVWVTVGAYGHFEYDTWIKVLNLLIGELLLAIGFGLLVISTLTLGLRRGWFKKILILVGWVLWGINTFSFRPALLTGPYGKTASYYDYTFLAGGILVLIILALYNTSNLTRIGISRKILLRLATIGLGSIFLFLLPYILWALNILPEYVTAIFFALSFGVAILFIGWQATHKLIEQIAIEDKE
ncbi:MAG: hypothetical protein B6I38_02675 [Anaerolineaceae bacterium 4572_5.1]|nr:MAG: hypothetical protein B5M51_08895 [Anaerolinea sp. 4484_236]OQY34208.1 MAG: hypothetical protein B6I38_02675 [Anaerolineaceae bacterium 4572_5.1]RLD07410.1 MAG: hypothetical protein DRI56_06730 [Chloroflexota bacterium]